MHYELCIILNFIINFAVRNGWSKARRLTTSVMILWKNDNGAHHTTSGQRRNRERADT